MSSGHQRIKWHRNIAENFNQPSRVHERYRQMTDDRRQTDGRRHITNMNMSSRSLIKMKLLQVKGGRGDVPQCTIAADATARTTTTAQ